MNYHTGDWPVVSPDPILVDEKTSPTRRMASDHTHVPAWHFKPLQLPPQLTIRI